jgi:hypothetical protein
MIDIQAQIKANIEQIKEGDDSWAMKDEEIAASAALQFAIETITGQPCDYVVIEGRTVTYLLVDENGDTGDDQTFTL